MSKMISMDSALSFMLSQTSHIEREVLRQPYPAVRYWQDIPVDTSPSPYASSVTFFTQDAVGQPKFINNKGDDIPVANIYRTKYETGFDMGGIGYTFSLFEIGQAQMLGVNLPTEGAMAARQSYEQFVDGIAYLGHAEAGTTGLFNDPDVQDVAGVDFATAAPDDILNAINGPMADVFADTDGMLLPNTVRLPVRALAALVTRRLTDNLEVTLLKYLQDNNLYTLTTGQRLDIQASHRLVDKMVIYQKSPDVLKLYMAQELTFIAPQPRNLEIVVPGWFRFSPVNIRQRQAFRYVTGVWAP